MKVRKATSDKTKAPKAAAAAAAAPAAPDANAPDSPDGMAKRPDESDAARSQAAAEEMRRLERSSAAEHVQLQKIERSFAKIQGTDAASAGEAAVEKEVSAFRSNMRARIKEAVQVELRKERPDVADQLASHGTDLAAGRASPGPDD